MGAVATGAAISSAFCCEGALFLEAPFIDLLLVSDKSAYNFCMIEFKFKAMLVRLDFSFFAVLTVFLLFDKTGFGLSAIAACGLHEMSHLIMMTVFGISAEKITFYGAGIRISSSTIELANPPAKAVVLSAGCAANFLGAAALFFFGNPEAAVINLVTGLFNLLPIGELDGAGLLRMCVIKLCKPENVDNVLKIFTLVCLALCVPFVIIFSDIIPFTLLVTIVYIIVVGSCNI